MFCRGRIFVSLDTVTALLRVSDTFVLLVCDGYCAEKTGTAGFARQLFTLAVH
jgi:hypothetical protein